MAGELEGREGKFRRGGEEVRQVKESSTRSILDLIAFLQILPVLY